jgi:DNA-binding MarR family transcriptional regulator
MDHPTATKEMPVDADDAVRLRRAIARLARQLNTSATGEGLTPTQASVLGLIVGHGPVGLPELMRLEHLNPTMLSRVIGRLDELGFIDRSPDPGDLRSVTVSVTDDGRTVHERIKAQRAAAVSDAAGRLPTAEQRALIDALDAMDHLAAELN